MSLAVQGRVLALRSFGRVCSLRAGGLRHVIGFSFFWGLGFRAYRVYRV